MRDIPYLLFSQILKKIYQISKKITFLTESFLRARTVFLLKVYAIPFRKKTVLTIETSLVKNVIFLEIWRLFSENQGSILVLAKIAKI